MIPYFVLIFIFSLLSEVKWRGHYILRIVSVILLILFIGLRNEIGMDYRNYQEAFYNTAYFGIDEVYYEPGWYLLNKFIHEYSTNFKVVTLVHATLLVSFLYLTLKDFKYYTFAFVLFILLENGYIFIVNGMRQGLAMAIFFYSWKFIKSRSALKYWACILLATSMHISILFVSPIYWLANRTYSYWFYLITQFASFLLLATHLTDSLLVRLMSVTSYAHYISSQFMDISYHWGISYLSYRIGVFIVLLFYNRLLKEHPQYIVIFNMFFFLVVSNDLFDNIKILSRMPLYFEWSKLIVIPIFLSTIFRQTVLYVTSRWFVLVVCMIFFIYCILIYPENLMWYTL